MENWITQINDKLKDIPDARKYIELRPYAELVDIDIFNEYENNWNNFDEIMEDVFQKLFEEWHVEEYQKMREEFNIIEQWELDKDKWLSVDILNYKY